MSIPQYELTTWYYEMFAPPAREHVRPVPAGLEIIHQPEADLPLYRAIYETIGKPWCWWERRRQTDEEIAAEIHAPNYELYFPQVDGVPMGMVEFDKRQWPGVQLNYFGIFDEFTGRGIGGYLLDWSVDHVFAAGATRYWLHTCSLDSPNACLAYERAGFQCYDTVVTMMDDPRVT
jgi:GNAT superfamily N-acetyltransferase